MNGLIDGHWIGVHDGDARARAIYLRHYSAFRRKSHSVSPHFVGVGEKMVLLTLNADALFVWRYTEPGKAPTHNHPDMRRVRRGNKPSSYEVNSGVWCTIFRNEGNVLSSELIEEACQLAWQRWPGERLSTYVWDAKVKSVNPGFCFKKAGWRTCGRNKDGRLTILELLPKRVDGGA